MDARALAHRLKTASWAGVWDRTQQLVELLRGPARIIRRKVAGVPTTSSVGYWLSADGQQLGLQLPAHLPVTQQACVRAVAKRSHDLRSEPLTLEEMGSGLWVKVAYSPFLRNLGEWTNFLPGTYPGGIANHPGVLSGTLTSSLLGAGLGYGVGAGLEHFLPESWERGKARKTFAMLGAAPGLMAGGGMMLLNKAQGKPILDNTTLNHAGPDDVPGLDWIHPDAPEFKEVQAACRDVELSPVYLKSAASFSRRAFGEAGSYDNIAVPLNQLGQVLYEGNVPGPTRQQVLAAAQVASMMPGGVGPGYATPHQFGQMAQRLGGHTIYDTAVGAAKGYMGGVLAGKALGLLGAPGELQDWIRDRGTMLGVVEAVLPHLLGQ